METETDMLELTEEHRTRIRELQSIADEAEDDPDARRRLRAALRDSSPAVVAKCSDTALVYRGLLAETASGGSQLVKDAILERARLMAGELAGVNATPLEVLLSDRVASLWVLVELQEALQAAWYSKGGTGGRRPPLCSRWPAYRSQPTVGISPR